MAIETLGDMYDKQKLITQEKKLTLEIEVHNSEINVKQRELREIKNKFQKYEAKEIGK